MHLYHDWNAKINVISRKDIDNLYEHHILHSLAIAKCINFREGTNALDFGTGGGFPGIPLAIFFPEANFKLIDGTGKKVRVHRKLLMQLALRMSSLLTYVEKKRKESLTSLYHVQ